MKGMILIMLIGLLAATSAYACMAFKTGEYTSGMNKICRYDHLGSDYHMTIKSYQMCPLSVNVRH